MLCACKDKTEDRKHSEMTVFQRTDKFHFVDGEVPIAKS